MKHPELKELDNIHVFNTTTAKGVVTNKNGTFEITSHIGDTLLVSSLQFKKKTILVSLEHYVSKTITIQLEDTTTELDAVLLKNHNLSGNLEQDANTIHTTPVVNAVSLGIIDREIPRLSKPERDLHAAASGGGLFPLGAAINAISGKTKKIKKRIAVMKAGQRIEALVARFPTSYFTKELGIPKDEIYLFLYFCETDPEYRSVIEKKDLQVMLFLKEKSGEYQKR